jgi:hypothetical protein
MKKIILYFILTLSCVQIYAQDVKRCFFVGRYESNKRGFCGDQEVVTEEIEDYFDFVIKSKAFEAEHKSQKPLTNFISQDESVIIYRYDKIYSAWSCTSNVIGLKTGKSIEDCKNQLSTNLEKFPLDFSTTPNIMISWQGKGNNSSEYTKDFGGVSAKFLSFKNYQNEDLIYARLKNKLSDKTAIIIMQTDAGMLAPEYLKPGEALSKKFNTKKMEIQIIYQDYNDPLPIFDIDTGINFIKGKVREQIENNGGVIKSRSIRVDGIRG